MCLSFPMFHAIFPSSSKFLPWNVVDCSKSIKLIIRKLTNVYIPTNISVLPMTVHLSINHLPSVTWTIFPFERASASHIASYPISFVTTTIRHFNSLSMKLVLCKIPFVDISFFTIQTAISLHYTILPITFIMISIFMCYFDFSWNIGTGPKRLIWGNKDDNKQRKQIFQVLRIMIFQMSGNGSLPFFKEHIPLLQLLQLIFVLIGEVDFCTVDVKFD